MSEKATTTPTKVILEEAIAEIRKAFPFGSPDKDHAKVAELLIDLPARLGTANDFGSFPNKELENIRHWAESARKSRDGGDVERVPFDVLYTWGSKKGDKNTLEKLFDRVYPETA